MLVVQTIAAPRPAKRRRRAREAEGGPPGELPLTRITAVKADPFANDSEAAEWLQQLSGDHDALLD
ncbi:MAG: hypothetical protein M3O76_04160, partial [Actinomycetota bacterium]|nr:hypothetical protein [Actinomycetota bacterium]